MWAEIRTLAIPPLETFKIIRDPIHGYIPLTRLEYEIIQLPVFNRLHHVKQMAAGYLVFPGAVSTRFMHCVGAMSVSSKMAYAALGSLDSGSFSELFLRHDPETEIRIVQMIRLAALLHDIGHGPFSHSSEKTMSDALKKYPSEVDEAKRLFKKEDVHELPIHEYNSYKLITHGELKEAIDSSHSGMSAEVAALLINQEGIANENCTDSGRNVLHNIISGQLDADRLDYLLRDGYMTGVVFGSIDVDRLIMHLQIRKEGGIYKIVTHERALGTIEDTLDARFKMYKWVYNHHLVLGTDLLIEAATDYLIKSKKMHFKDFHWEAFESGGMTDEYVMSKIMEQNESEGRNYAFKGLIDRRYLPVSLLKRSTEFQRFILNVAEKMGSTIVAGQALGAADEKRAKDAIRDWFKKQQKQSKSAKVPVGQRRHRARLLTVNSPRTPYHYLRQSEKVWIFSEKENISNDITAVSPYFNAVNQAWEEFPSFYIGFHVPGLPRNSPQYTEYKNDIYSTVTSEISTS